MNATSTTSLPQAKACELCGGIIRMTFSNGRPRLKRYAQQRFCSRPCSALSKKRAPVDRFRTKYKVASNGCWQWTSGLNSQGYGSFYDGEKHVGAHCFSYRQFRGPIAPWLTVDHVCRNRACVNPLHLRLLSNLDNTLAGIGPTALNKRKTRCVHGHRFAQANTYIRKDGSRRCRQCRLIRYATLQRKRTVPNQLLQRGRA
jgi:HNH endonuclease